MLNITISGNVIADAIIKNVNGQNVVSFTVAHNNRYKTRTGETREEVCFISCNIWEKPQLLPLFFKGRPVTVTGNLKCKAVDNRVFYNLSVYNHHVFGAAKRSEGNQPPAQEMNNFLAQLTGGTALPEELEKEIVF